MVKEISFFLIEIHAYKIGESIPAPKFEIIEKPNDFIKNIKSSNDGELNKSQSERIIFWSEFNELVSESGKPFNIRKVSSDHWYDIALGTSEAHISVTLVNKSNNIGVEVYIDDNKELFDFLESNRDEIEEKLGFPMEWQRLDNKKASRIIYYINGLNFDDHSNYTELMKEIIEKVIIIRSIFKKYI